ncbi:MAG: hypothetical protein JRI26_10745, partial [Deltaproteobacteria bacterium]|nr:hypothetical protein [Deltaproteobacteria bacterium]
HEYLTLFQITVWLPLASSWIIVFSRIIPLLPTQNFKEPDIIEETTRIIENLKAALEKAHSGVEKRIKITV